MSFDPVQREGRWRRASPGHWVLTRHHHGHPALRAPPHEIGAWYPKFSTWNQCIGAGARCWHRGVGDSISEITLALTLTLTLTLTLFLSTGVNSHRHVTAAVGFENAMGRREGVRDAFGTHVIAFGALRAPVRPSRPLRGRSRESGPESRVPNLT